MSMRVLLYVIGLLRKFFRQSEETLEKRLWLSIIGNGCPDQDNRCSSRMRSLDLTALKLD